MRNQKFVFVLTFVMIVLLVNSKLRLRNTQIGEENSPSYNNMSEEEKEKTRLYIDDVVGRLEGSSVSS